MGLAILLALVSVVGGWELIGWLLPIYLGLQPGRSIAGMRIAGRWQVGHSMAELGGGRIFTIGQVEFYIGPLMDR